MSGFFAPGRLLRLEGAALFLVAATLYGLVSGDWILFALLVLAPDLGMLGYLRGPALGAATYNLTHTEVLPALLGLVAFLAGSGTLLALALIWGAHIGLDRAFGYGLKLASRFGDTHLGPIGRRRARV